MATTAPTTATNRDKRPSKRKRAARRVPFADLVRVHHRWRQAVDSDSTVSDPDRAIIDDEYHALLDRFEAEHGEIVNAYWCTHVESAVGLTKGPPLHGPFRRWRSPAPRFHRVSDWATKDAPEVARALHRCDELAIRTAEMLRGRSRRICMQLVMSSACHLLSIVDSMESNEQTAAGRKAALASEKRELADIQRDYREAANGDAQLIYFGGMALGILTLAGLYAIGLSPIGRGIRPDHGGTIVGCLVAGALGAIVSVISRVNSGSFALDADVGRGYTLFLGALRPWIGSIFGLLTYFAVKGGFVGFGAPDTSKGTNPFYFYCVVAFAAGFSERWAQDTLTGGLTGHGRGKDTQPAAAKPGAGTANTSAAARRSPLDGGGDVTPAAHE